MERADKKEILFVLNDLREMLMSYGVGGERIYGCDEWSTPVLNINYLLSIVERIETEGLEKQ